MDDNSGTANTSGSNNRSADEPLDKRLDKSAVDAHPRYMDVLGFSSAKQDFESKTQDPLRRDQAKDFTNTITAGSSSEAKLEALKDVLVQLADYDDPQEALDPREIDEFKEFFVAFFSSPEGNGRPLQPINYQSSVIPILYECLSDADNDPDFFFGALTNSLELIRNKVDREYAGLNSVTDGFHQLYDLINVELVRINTMMLIDYKHEDDTNLLSDVIIKINGQLEEKKEDLEELNRKFDSLERKYRTGQMSYIAVLGVFAALVMAVVSGMTFSASSFGSIASAGIINLIALSCAVGIVLVDIIYVALSFVWRLVHDDDDRKGAPTKAWVMILVNVAVLAACLILVTVIWCNPGIAGLTAGVDAAA